MSEPIVNDDDVRERATDPTRSILLRAPAGSGKTAVLTQRLLRLLARVDEPEQILAITFTRKAAAEMRERVLKALRGEIDPTHPQAQRLHALAAAVAAQDAARGWGLAEHPGRLRIQTIDAFNFWLASQLPVAARAGGALAVAERPDELYHRAARRVLIEGDGDGPLGADIALLFDRIDNHWRNVERLLAEMLRKRGHWLRYVLNSDPHVLSERVSESLREIVRDSLIRAVTLLEPARCHAAAVLPGAGKMGVEPEHLEAWQRFAALALRKDGEWRVRIDKSSGAAYEHPDAKQQLRDCISAWAGVVGSKEMLCEVRALPSASLNAEDATAIEALSRVLKVAAVQLQLEFAATGRVDYTYVAGAAREALVEDGLPTDLGLRTGLSLQHILVDEFQDTALAQFELLELLTVGWEPGDGRTLFAVGDPMQSIYQFRDAEVGLFLRARDRGIGQVTLESLQLTRNFRSVPELVAWANASFARIFPERDDVRASAVAFTPSAAARKGPPVPVTGARQLGLFDAPVRSAQAAVQVNVFGPDDRSAEARAIAQRIAAIRRGDAASTVAVLVVARTHAPPIVAALEEAAIPVIGVDLVPLGELSVVRDLVALLRALCHLGDRIAWLTVLRAPWCGLSLASLTALSRPRDPQLLWESLADEQRLERCESSDRARIARVRPVLAEALASRDMLALSEWLEAVWLRLGGADAYPEEDLLHARAFFSALGDLAARGEWRGPRDVDTLIAELFAQPRASSANPVQVMTIHRAKGLEFDHVFLPSLDRQQNRDRDPLLRWLDLPREEEGSDLLMSPVPIVGDAEGGVLNRYLKRIDSQRLGHERARLLYVAATRARESLHLSAAPKPRADGSIAPYGGTLLHGLWPAVAEEFLAAAAKLAPDGTTTPTGAANDARVRRLGTDWSAPPLADAPAMAHLPIGRESLEPPEFSWVGETARHIGTVVHAALERLAAAGELPTREHIERQSPEFTRQLRRSGLSERDAEVAGRIVVTALARTLADERGRWLFAREHRDRHSELALTGVADGRLTNVIIDRTFVDAAGTRWVIDFKTSRHEGSGLEDFLANEADRYRAQLARNADLARALGPEPVRAALYFPLLGVFREL
jgi:ATP-dependent helicase/nuclease subunit A